ncbi:hypothetical protein AB0I66_27590 [Streptomyces sp. NPDC050439]|uniref:hypothetical protein n=1 Tax=unclassified Streptomyces TaxID=2593676 RepID=UPI003432855C
MGRRGRLAAAVAAGVLAGLAGPAAAAHTATGFDEARSVYAVSVPAATASPSTTSSTAPSGVTPTSTTSPDPEEHGPEAPDAREAPDGKMADTGANVLPWIAAAAAGALGVGAVAFAMIRRRSD